MNKYGLDVDGVLANFIQAFINKCCEEGVACPKDWTQIKAWMFVDPKDFDYIWGKIALDENFWLSLPVLENSKKSITKLPPPSAYVTHRPVPSAVTKQWLLNNGFPEAKVISVAEPENKVLQLKMNKISLFVDDRVSSCRYFNDNGINCLLYSSPQQVSDDLSGLTVIKSLGELKKYL